MLATKRVFVACAAVAFMMGMSHLRAQQPDQQRADQPMVAHGQLVSVDADAQTLTVKASGGDTMVFHYTARTQVTGAQERVEGLATMAGATVTVQYTGEKNNLVATAIEVQPKK